LQLAKEVLSVNEDIDLLLVGESVATPFLDIVVTYAQFDSNIRVLYVFLGFLKIRPKIRIVVKVMQITITGPQKL